MKNNIHNQHDQEIINNHLFIWMYTFKSTSDILVLQRNSLTMYLVILKIQMTGPHYTSELMPTCTCMTSLCDLQMYIFLILCIHCTCNFAFIV